jgi:hypothetical protein
MIRNKKGVGVEDSPFFILATVAVMMLIVWIGMEIMIGFVEGNEYQAAIEASTEIYKRAKLLSLAYDGSTDSITVVIPEGYSVLIDGSIVTLGNNESLTEPLSIKGVFLTSEEKMLEPGQHDLFLNYSADDGTIYISQV